MRKWECTVCGYIHEGDEPPEECPVCSADKSMFIEITAETSTVDQEPNPDSSPKAQPSLATTIYTRISELILQYHLHPIAVHTPNGIVPMAIIFLFITTLFGYPFFETVAFYSLVFVLLAMPVVLFTGYETWQKRYRGAFTSMFKIKIGASILAFLLLLILVTWRTIQPDIITGPTVSSGRIIYLILSGLLLVAVGVAGHIGGKLVFGNRRHEH